MMAHLTLFVSVLLARSIWAQNSSSGVAQDLTMSTSLTFEEDLSVDPTSSIVEVTPTPITSNSVFPISPSTSSSSFFPTPSPTPTPAATPSTSMFVTSSLPIAPTTVDLSQPTAISPSPLPPMSTTPGPVQTLNTGVIVGAVVGGIGAILIVLVVVVVVVCYCCCCRHKYTEKYQQYSITTRYWDNTTGQSAHYQAGGSLRSINRNPSLRSSLGLRPKVGGQNGDYIANPTAELYSTPL